MTEPTTPQLTEAEVDDYEKRRYLAVRSYHSGDDVNWFLTVAIPALIRDWRAMRAENAALKKHWADTSEDLASAWLKHEEQKQSNTALREQLAEAQRQITLWFGPNTCSVCGGAPLASGRPCVCGGRGTMQAEFEGLRQELFNDDERISSLQSQLAQVTSERDVLKAVVDELHDVFEHWAEKIGGL